MRVRPITDAIAVRRHEASRGLDSRSDSASTPARVVIAGGGFAAVEAALALRALAGERVELTLISPQTTLAYRPAATMEVVQEGALLSYDLREIASHLGATFQLGALDAVFPSQRTVQLESGWELGYDSLILATGARAVVGVPGALTFRDQRDVARLRVILDQLARGALSRVLFAIPSKRVWPLPAYELALATTHRAAQAAVAAEVTLVTPEDRPLAVFGAHASGQVADLLSERGIRFIGGVTPHGVAREGSLKLEFDGSVTADRIIALPELRAQRIPGVPGTWAGFVPADPLGRVEGLDNVYAAGDMTTFPIKQGGLAAQQADRVAQTIASELGVPLKEMGEPHVLRARLLTGDGALVLRTELDASGRPIAGGTEHRESRQAEDLKVFGRYLTPYLSLHGRRLRAQAA